jgi:hypothetical protein
MTEEDEIWDSLFHGAAWIAYLEVWRRTGQFPPDSETTRIRAFQLYEEALAEKNRHKQPQGSDRTPQREAGPGCDAPEGGGMPRQQSASPTRMDVPIVPHALR